jgi:hypothetical protein
MVYTESKAAEKQKQGHVPSQNIGMQLPAKQCNFPDLTDNLL